MRAISAFLIALAVLWHPSAAAEEEPDAVAEAKLRALVERVERRHTRHRTFRADFVQVVHLRAQDETFVRKGRLAFKRRGKLSFRYEGGDWVVSNGRRVRSYVREHRTLYVMKAKRSLYPAVLAFLKKKGSLSEHFALRRIEAPKSGVILEAVPKKPTPAVAKIWLLVERRTGKIRRALLVDGQGNTNRFVFRDAEYGVTIPSSRFRAPDTPKGTRVVEP